MARRGLALFVLGLLAATPAAAQKASPGQVAYVDGLRAFDAGDYATAAGRMRTALAEDAGEATARFRYRAQNAEDYFPHLWLGLSLEKLGDRSGARTALEESQRQGSVKARPALGRILSAALLRLTPPSPAPTPLSLPPLSLPSPSPVPAEPSPVAMPSLPTPASPAARAPTTPTGPLALPTRALSVAATVAAGASTVAQRSGLRAFFRGDYENAERLLAPDAGRSPVARIFLAWSLGGRYLLGGSRDPELLSRARVEYAAALLAGAPATGGRWVSPSILALFGAAEGAR